LMIEREMKKENKKEEINIIKYLSITKNFQ
jgi:hypothetical protein